MDGYIPLCNLQKGLMLRNELDVRKGLNMWKGLDVQKDVELEPSC